MAWLRGEEERAMKSDVRGVTGGARVSQALCSRKKKWDHRPGQTDARPTSIFKMKRARSQRRALLRRRRREAMASARTPICRNLCKELARSL